MKRFLNVPHRLLQRFKIQLNQILASFLLLPFLWPLPQLADSSVVWVILVAVIIILILVVVILALIFALRRQPKPDTSSTRESEIDTQVSARQVSAADEVTLPSTNGPALAVPIAEDESTAPSQAVSASPAGRDGEMENTHPSLPQSHIVGQAITVPISEQRPPTINWQIAGLTHVGMKRDANEDKFMMLESDMNNGTACGVYVVADGMGGHEHGEVASALTIDTIQAHFAETPLGEAPYEDWISTTVDAANEAVIFHQTDKHIEKKMGSTLIMAVIAEGQAYIANVGDSRAYHLNNDFIKQISVDHSLVERLIQIGQITREEARTHKQRNVIYSTIGDSKAKLQVGTYHIDLQPGDRLLLCSDGLSGMLTDEQIFNISRSHDSVAETCQTLVKAANSAGGTDNITVIIIEMNG